MKRFFLYPFCLIISLHQPISAQHPCKNFDLLNVPGQWKWKVPGNDRYIAPQLWTICDPISKDFQRIMPQAPDGIIAYSLMTGGDAGTFYNLSNGPRYYQHYIMIKDYECAMKPNPVAQPEGETGCWIYFDVNNHKGYGMKLPGQSDVMYDEHRYLYLTNAWLEKDANGNQLLYTSSEKDIVIKQGFVFTEKGRFPYKKVTRKELYNSYKLFHEKRINKLIAEFEKIVQKNDQEYNSLTAAQKKEQNYRLDIIKRDKGVLEAHKKEKEKVEHWYATVMQQPNLMDTAYVQKIVYWAFEPEKLDAKPGEGYTVWTDDIDFYDRSKPIYQPQYIFLQYRHQDDAPPKKNFMEKFTSTFNLDVLWKMVGGAPRKPGGVNTILSSFVDSKKETKSQQQSNGPVTFNFDNTADGQFPADWIGMKNIGVQAMNENKWLAMTKDGYWYPRQYNKEIKDGFDLSFDLKWNADIAYYSGYFTLMMGEMRYDNAAEKYHLDENKYMYSSLYDGYAGSFNRVMLWFDPYWNDGGTLEVYSYDRHETVKVSKKIVLPGFYKEKNNHRITIQRKGNSLIVIDNGKTIADIGGVFLPEVKYNLFTFSRYKGDKNDQKDIFYINNININY